MVDQIVEVPELIWPGATGDITPEARAALAEMRDLHGATKAFQDKAMSELVGDPGSLTRGMLGSVMAVLVGSSTGITPVEALGCVAGDPGVDNGALLNAGTREHPNGSILFSKGVYWFQTPISLYRPNLVMMVGGSSLDLNSTDIVDTAVTVNGPGHDPVSGVTLFGFTLNCHRQASTGLFVDGVRQGNLDVWVYEALKLGIWTRNGSGNRGFLYTQGTTEQFCDLGIRIQTTDDIWECLTPVNNMVGVEFWGGGSTIGTIHPWRSSNKQNLPLVGIRNHSSKISVNTLVNDAIPRMFELTDDYSSILVDTYIQYDTPAGVSSIFHIPKGVTQANVVVISKVRLDSDAPFITSEAADVPPMLPAVLSLGHEYNGKAWRDPFDLDANPYMPCGTYIVSADSKASSIFTQAKTGSPWYGGMLEIHPRFVGPDMRPYQLWTFRSAAWMAVASIDGKLNAGTQWRIVKYAAM